MLVHCKLEGEDLLVALVGAGLPCGMHSVQYVRLQLNKTNKARQFWGQICQTCTQTVDVPKRLWICSSKLQLVRTTKNPTWRWISQHTFTRSRYSPGVQRSENNSSRDDISFWMIRIYRKAERVEHLADETSRATGYACKIVLVKLYLLIDADYHVRSFRFNSIC